MNERMRTEMKIRSTSLFAVVMLAGLFQATALRAEDSGESNALPSAAEAKQAVKDGAQAVGETTRDVTKAIGHGTRDTVKAIGHGTRSAVQGVGSATKNAWEELKE